MGGLSEELVSTTNSLEVGNGVRETANAETGNGKWRIVIGAEGRRGTEAIARTGTTKAKMETIEGS